MRSLIVAALSVSSVLATVPDYAVLHRKISVHDSRANFVIAVTPLRNAQPSALPLWFQTWGDGNSGSLTMERARDEHHLPGYEGVVLASGETSKVVEENLKLSVGNAFDSNMLVHKVQTEDAGWVGTVTAGLDSTFAEANPLFTISPSLLAYHLSVDAVPECDMIYVPVDDTAKGWWRVRGGYVSISGVTSAVDMLQIVTSDSLGLDSVSWTKFWDVVYQSIPHTDWFYGDDGLRYSSNCPSLEGFPTIQLNVGGYETELTPMDYLMEGSLVSDAGCTVLLSESGSYVSLGAPFFSRTIVAFDNANKRVGFCLPK